MTSVRKLGLRLQPPRLELADGRAVLRTALRVESAIALVPHLRLQLPGAQGNSAESHYIAWLPRGEYRVDAILPRGVPAGSASFALEAWHQREMAYEKADRVEGEVQVPQPAAGAPEAIGWSVEALPPAPPLSELSWRKGHSDWFFRHFDHAGPTVMSYLLGDSPLLRGRILDVGCGDGITDLSIALRSGCRELVGIDPFRGYERLPGIVMQNHLPPDVIPRNLRFLPESGNALPFEDDSFDVVVSWGSLEHIAGGYMQCLREIRRVLRPEGLFFVHPGLYYSNYGHHLGEFSSEPFFHLKKPLEEVRRIVFETPPSYMDRSGEFATPAQYWQWFRELNPITVAGFEQELRSLDFQPWRVAIRTEGLIEYTPEIERYPMQDLATAELYVSCVNRKARS
ncbi:MAG TPA: class I SAM-dependent methyltransferase [Usitatibacter sp.]|nr:class I SAM-dependent methyltransferase [Usitatibacter sp.]